MRNIRKSLFLVLSSFPIFVSKDVGGTTGPEVAASRLEPIEPVQLRPLNYPWENLFAGHRSHSSHASHRSSSGGGYSQPQRAVPSNSGGATGSPLGAGQGVMSPSGAQPTDPGRGAPVSPNSAAATKPSLSNAEKLTLQIMRVQIALTSLGIFGGEINGKLDDKTKEALRRFQIVKNLEPTGKMTTDTLNALGVPGVQ